MKKSQFIVQMMSLLLFISSLFSSCSQDTDFFYEAVQENIEEQIENNQNDQESNNSNNEEEENTVIDDNVSTKLKAFPSAEGAGSFTVGGRGGEVIHVTNLNDSGPGSFREACMAQTPRTIVFDVSGTIDLLSPLGVENGTTTLDHITIAGQTAPKGGITITGYRFYFGEVSNIVIRYIRFRPNPISNNEQPGDALGFYKCNNVVLDHVSASYGNDEVIDFSGHWGSEDITVQRSIIAEGKTAVLLSPDSRDPALNRHISILKNLFAHNHHRTPNVQGDIKADVINNVIYNTYIRMAKVSGITRTNYIGNYHKVGPITSQVLNDGNALDSQYLNHISSYANPLIYMADNYFDGLPSLNNDDFDMWVFVDGSNYKTDQTEKESNYRVNEPFTYIDEPTGILSANEAYSSVLADVGANKYLNANGTYGTYLDSPDSRWISDTEKGTYERFSPDGFYEFYYHADRTGLDYGTIPEEVRNPNYDTDGDGMPNVWEIANGFNPDVADDSGDADGDGYTNLEEFLNLVDINN